MADVLISKDFHKEIDVDGSLRARAYEFITKLSKDHTSPGLHVEHIKGARDPRVRTGRVNDDYRAVMFLAEGQAEPLFVLVAIKKHDEANRFAGSVAMKVNPVNGVLEVLQDSQPEIAEPQTVASAGVADSDLATLLCAYTAKDLVETLGVDPTIAHSALAAANEDDLLLAIEKGPSWQAEAVLALATGTPLNDVIDQLSLVTAGASGASGAGAGETPASASTDADQINLAYEKPASQMDFVRVTNDDELKQVLAGSLAQWRVFLHPEQRKYATAATSGSFRLSGGAGTGKTVVALHRARTLARRNPQARIVLTTYTTTLADNLRRDLAQLDPSLPTAQNLGEAGIYVVGVDKLARDALTTLPAEILEQVAPNRGLSDSRNISALKDQESRAEWLRAVSESGVSLDAELKRPSFLDAEYRNVVLANDVQSRDAYARVGRAGRGVRLSRPQRLAIWQVIEGYRRSLAMNGTASFAEIAALAGRGHTHLAQQTGHQLVDHIIIDEAQDLHTGHWLLLRSLVAHTADDLFICEDSHQRIYGEKVVLSRFSVLIRGRSRRLTLNYRTTRQNLHFATGLLAGADVTDLEGEAEDAQRYRSPMSGPAPKLMRTATISEELDTVASVVRNWIDEGVDPGGIAVLVRSSRVSDLMSRGLADRKVTVRGPNAVGKKRSPQLLTMHRAKGLEFLRVVLAGVDDAQVPARGTLGEYTAEEREDATQRERFLLYVAASRARDELVVTWHGRPSPFLGGAGD